MQKINAIIRGKLGINPSEIPDVDLWIEAYSQADYLLKLERTLHYAAIKQAVVEVVNQMYKKERHE